MNVYEERWEEAIWVCSDCGRKFGGKHPDELKDMMVTMHYDTCDVCQSTNIGVSSKWDYLDGCTFD